MVVLAFVLAPVFSCADGQQIVLRLRFQQELNNFRQRLAASAEYITYSHGPRAYPELQREIQRWLAANPGANAADGFRSGLPRALGQPQAP
jgi:crotonobetainyl-CoA:carnitine CoA-transferase CaiB-like acyl-CoA transferase